MKTFKALLPALFYIAAFILTYGLGYVRGKDKGYDTGYIAGLQYATDRVLAETKDAFFRINTNNIRKLP